MKNKQIDMYFKEYLMYLKMNKRASKNTFDNYRRDIEQYLLFIEKNYGLDNYNNITLDQIRNFIKSLKRQNLSTASICRKISSIRDFHKFLKKEGVLVENVAMFIDMPKVEKKLPSTLSIEEVDSLIESIDTSTTIGLRNKALIEMFYATGFRVSEICNLETKDLNMTMGFVKTYSKGNKERIVPLGEEATTALRKYLLESRPILSREIYSDYVFLNKDGKSISRQGIYKLIKKLVEEAEINKDVTPHTLRHSFATHLIENGIGLRELQSLLGHSDVTTTQIYIHISNIRLKNIYEENHPRANIKES